MIFNELFGLEGKRAVVTGGSMGLGYVAALTLAKAGASVAICSRSCDESVAAAKKIEELTNQKCYGYGVDVSEESQVKTLFTKINDTLGNVDILHCAAGINIRKPTQDLLATDWDAVMDVNAKGSFLCAQQVIKSMSDRGWGRIVFYGSMLSYVTIPGRAAYSASKAALLGLTKTLALENAQNGVCVNAICPGPFVTPMNQTINQDESVQRDFLRKLPIGRWGNPDELRGLLLYLSSPACSFMTGSGVVIDGGWTAQ